MISLVHLRRFFAERALRKRIFRLPHEPYLPGSDERVVEIPWAMSCYDRERLVLEVGCSFATDAYIEALRKLRIPELHGIDVSGREAPFFIKKTADIRDSGYPSSFFGLIFCISTIEHIGMDNRARYEPVHELPVTSDADTLALLEIRRILKSGGRIVLTVPFGKYHDYGWFFQYDRARLDSLIKRSRLRIIQTDYFHYRGDGWYSSDAHALTNTLYQGNGAPCAAGVACVLLTKP